MGQISFSHAAASTTPEELQAAADRILEALATAS
jgi:hypothetical protein